MRLSAPVFFFNDAATTEIYTLSLHDALPISNNLGDSKSLVTHPATTTHTRIGAEERARLGIGDRSEEHTSELQSRQYLVCRLLLDKKDRLPALPAPRRRPSSRDDRVEAAPAW